MDAQVTILEEWGGLELIEASFERPRFPRHAHPTYAIGVVHRGVNHFRYRGSEHCAHAGTVCTVTPDEAHDVEPKSPHGFAYRCLYPSNDLVQTMAESLRGAPVHHTLLLPPVLRDPELARLIGLVFETGRGRAASLARDTALAALLRRAFTRYAERPLSVRPAAFPRRAIAIARDYLASRYSENVTLKSLAETAGLDVFALVRGFRLAYGVPPHAWLMQERVRRAQALLRSGRPPAQVATVVGFADQSHLTRCFKRIVGITPGCYRAGAGTFSRGRSERVRDSETPGS